jgi:hypothetical protein
VQFDSFNESSGLHGKWTWTPEANPQLVATFRYHGSQPYEHNFSLTMTMGPDGVLTEALHGLKQEKGLWHQIWLTNGRLEELSPSEMIIE